MRISPVAESWTTPGTRPSIFWKSIMGDSVIVLSLFLGWAAKWFASKSKSPLAGVAGGLGFCNFRWPISSGHGSPPTCSSCGDGDDDDGDGSASENELK